MMTLFADDETVKDLLKFSSQSPLKKFSFVPQSLATYILPSGPNDFRLAEIKYEKLSDRLATYRHMPRLHRVSAILLARAGFIYIGNNEQDQDVMCPFCHIFHSSLQLGNNAQEIHRRHSPSCTFLTRPREEGSYCELFSSTGLIDASNANSSQVEVAPRPLQVEAVSRPPQVEVVPRPSQVEVSRPPRVEAVPRPFSVFNPQTASSSQPENIGTLNSTQNTVKSSAGGPTYSELGIVTERPKIFEYALLAKRLETFLSWPRDHHLRPKELAEAGFYYAGYGDCARCFYCGGGLRNWEDEDDVWVEHARWFPRCAYIRQQMGQVFVDTVQELDKINDRISFPMVITKIGHAAAAFHLDSKDNPLKRDPAVKTLMEMGYPLVEVLAVANTIINEGNILSADTILKKLVSGNIRTNLNLCSICKLDKDKTNSEKEMLEEWQKLKEKNNQLRQQTICKICMDKEVAVVFLPCGHFVSCTDCAAAMKDCPVCRARVKGTVRAFIS